MEEGDRLELDAHFNVIPNINKKFKLDLFLGANKLYHGLTNVTFTGNNKCGFNVEHSTVVNHQHQKNPYDKDSVSSFNLKKLPFVQIAALANNINPTFKEDCELLLKTTWSAILQDKNNVIDNPIKNLSESTVVQNINVLRNSSNICLVPTDKTNAFIAINSDNLHYMILNQHLNDNTSYMKTSQQEFMQHILNVNKFLTVFRKQLKLGNKNILKSLKVSNPQPAKFRLCVKDHKPKVDGYFQTRLIINQNNTPTANLSVLLERLIHKATSKLQHANNNLLKAVTNIKTWENISTETHRLIKIDIEKLYPSITPDEAIHDCLNIIENDELLSKAFKDINLPMNLLSDALKICTNYNYLRLGDCYFKQMKGLPIGSCLSGTLSELYLHKTIQITIKQFQEWNITFERYVDDFALAVPNSIATTDIMKFLNSIDPSLNFVVEEEGQNIPFLQTTLNLNQSGSVDLRWHIKPQKGLAFLNYNSYTAKSTKRAVIFNTLHSLKTIYGFNDIPIEDIHLLRDLLDYNDFPRHFVDKCIIEFQQRNRDITNNNIEILREPPVQKVKIEKFTEFLDYNKDNISTVPSDGHCLLHSFAKATNIRLQKIISTLRLYFAHESCKLSEFFSSQTHNEIEDYLKFKKWNASIGDLIPKALSDCFHSEVNVYLENSLDNKIIKTTFTPDEISNSVATLPTKISSEKDANILHTVHLLLRNHHYQPILGELILTQITEATPTLSYTQLQTKINKQKEGNASIYSKPTFTIPFTTDKTKEIILHTKKSLTNQGLFNVAFKNTSNISNIINKLNNKYLYNKNHRSLDNNNTEGVIYSAKCKLCHEAKTNYHYIGETGRKLSIRMKEHCHLQRDQSNAHIYKSAIAEHCVLHHQSKPALENWDFRILTKQTDSFKRCILEAYHINKLQPLLNRDKGAQVIAINFMEM